MPDPAGDGVRLLEGATRGARGEGELHVQVDRKRIKCRVRRNGRARKLRLTVDTRRGLRLVVPRSVPMTEARSFLLAQGDWLVTKALPVVEEHEKLTTRPRLPASVSLFGEQFRIDFKARKGVARASAFDGSIVVRASDEPAARSVLTTWLRRTAGTVLPVRLQELAAAHGFSSPRRVQVRNQQTRWGSCSSSGTITLNWRLVLLPAEIADYIMLHELVHRIYPDHGASFYAALRKCCTGADDRRKWLNDNGHRYMTLF